METLTTALLKTLVPIVVGFGLSGLVGTRLLQGWQLRSWLMQQRFLGHEKEYVALKELADEISSSLGIRIFHMQRMLRMLGNTVDDDFVSYHEAYRESVERWNERLTSFYVRLTMLAETNFALRLERSIQNSLVPASSIIDALIRDKKANRPVSRKLIRSVRDDVNRLQGKAIGFNQSLLRAVQQRRTDIYYGKRIAFSVENLRYFSTWRLVKALFVREVNLHSIVNRLSVSPC
jgi:hypothetical protein